MAASVAGNDHRVAAGTDVFLLSLPAEPPASVVRTVDWDRALPSSGLRLSRSARLAVRVTLFLVGLVAAAILVVVLGSHRAEAAARPVEKPVPGAVPGSAARVAPGAVRTSTASPAQVRRTFRSEVRGGTGPLAPATQALRPIVRQVSPAATSVTQTLRPLVGQVSPVTTSVTMPVGQALRHIVPQGRGALSPLAQILGTVPRYVAQPNRPVAAPAPISGTYASVRPGPTTSRPPAAASGGPTITDPPILSTGSHLSALDSRGTRPHAGSRLPTASVPLGAVPAPTPGGSSGAGHGATGLLASLLARWRSLGLLMFIVGLIALWSAGRPAPRPEVSPA
jgi:hypothetical protein